MDSTIPPSSSSDPKPVRRARAQQKPKPPKAAAAPDHRSQSDSGLDAALSLFLTRELLKKASKPPVVKSSPLEGLGSSDPTKRDSFQLWMLEELLRANIADPTSNMVIPNTDSEEGELAAALSMDASTLVRKTRGSKDFDFQKNLIAKAIKDTQVEEEMGKRLEGFTNLSEDQKQDSLLTQLEEDIEDRPGELTDLGEALMIFADREAEASCESNGGNPLKALMICETACSLISGDAALKGYGNSRMGMGEMTAVYADRLAKYKMERDEVGKIQ